MNPETFIITESERRHIWIIKSENNVHIYSGDGRHIARSVILSFEELKKIIDILEVQA